MKATDDQIREAYARLSSCRKVASLFGMCPQSVHERLQKIGISNPVRIFTELEREVLVAEYEQHAKLGRLDLLAVRMGRTKAFLCRQARALGLTSQTRPRRWASGQEAGDRVRAAQALHGHPRGMLGKPHSAATRERISEAGRRRWAELSQEEREELTMRSVLGRKASGGKTTSTNRESASWKAGWREIGGQRNYYRSMWEANYARYLEWLREQGQIEAWEHEPKTFWFDTIRRGVRSYKPDFRVVERGGAVCWHEVKGWMDTRSRTTIKRFAKYYPDETLILIDKTGYNAIKRQMAPTIIGWELKSVVETDLSDDARKYRRIRRVAS